VEKRGATPPSAPLLNPVGNVPAAGSVPLQVPGLPAASGSAASPARAGSVQR